MESTTDKQINEYIDRESDIQIGTNKEIPQHRKITDRFLAKRNVPDLSSSCKSLNKVGNRRTTADHPAWIYKGERNGGRAVKRQENNYSRGNTQSKTFLLLLDWAKALPRGEYRGD